VIVVSSSREDGSFQSDDECLVFGWKWKAQFSCPGKMNLCSQMMNVWSLVGNEKALLVLACDCVYGVALYFFNVLVILFVGVCKFLL